MENSPAAVRSPFKEPLFSTPTKSMSPKNSPVIGSIRGTKMVSDFVTRIEKENHENLSPLRKRGQPENDDITSKQTPKRQRIALADMSSPKAFATPSPTAPPYPDTPPPPLVLCTTPRSGRRKSNAVLRAKTLSPTKSPATRALSPTKRAPNSPAKKSTPKRSVASPSKPRRRIASPAPSTPKQQIASREVKSPQDEEGERCIKLIKAYNELKKSTCVYQDALDKHPKYQSLLFNGGVDEADIKQLFPNSRDLQTVNRELLADLVRLMDNTCLSSSAPFDPHSFDESSLPAEGISNTFITFAGNARKHYLTWMKHVNAPAVKQLKEKLRKQFPTGLEGDSLETILILPVQRICKFGLMLHNIAKYSSVPEQAACLRMAANAVNVMNNDIDRVLSESENPKDELLHHTCFKEFLHGSDYARKQFVDDLKHTQKFCPEITFTARGHPVISASITHGVSKDQKVYVLDEYLLVTVRKGDRWIAKQLLDIAYVFLMPFDSQDSKGQPIFGLLLLYPGEGSSIGTRYFFQLADARARNQMQHRIEKAVKEYTATHETCATERSHLSISWNSTEGPHVERAITYTLNHCSTEAFNLNATTNEAVEELMMSPEYQEYMRRKAQTHSSSSALFTTPQKKLRSWGASLHGSAKKLISKELMHRTPRSRRGTISYNLFEEEENE